MKDRKGWPNREEARQEAFQVVKVLFFKIFSRSRPYLAYFQIFASSILYSKRARSLLLLLWAIFTLKTMSKALSFWGYLLLLQALFAAAYGRQRHLMAPEPQISPSNVTVPALEPAMEPPALELVARPSAETPPSPSGQTAAQQVSGALGTASNTVSNVGGAAVNGTADVAYALVGTAASLARTVQDLGAVIGNAVGRKLQAVETQN